MKFDEFFCIDWLNFLDIVLVLVVKGGDSGSGRGRAGGRADESWRSWNFQKLVVEKIKGFCCLLVHRESGRVEFSDEKWLLLNERCRSRRGRRFQVKSLLRGFLTVLLKGRRTFSCCFSCWRGVAEEVEEEEEESGNVLLSSQSCWRSFECFFWSFNSEESLSLVCTWREKDHWGVFESSKKGKT